MAKISAFKMAGIGKRGKEGGSWCQDAAVSGDLLNLYADEENSATSAALPSIIVADSGVKPHHAS